MHLIAGGREADVYALDAGRVLRRYRDPDASCEREAELMAWVGAHGYPVPRVYSATGQDLVLERVAGPTQVESLVAGTTTVAEVGRVLADLLTRLHEVPPPPGHPAGQAVCHFDLHPFNVLESPKGPVVIDWHNSTVARGAVDVAFTGVILAQAALAPADLVPDAVAPMVRGMLEAFLANIDPLDAGDVEDAIRWRARDPSMSGSETAVLVDVPPLLLG